MKRRARQNGRTAEEWNAAVPIGTKVRYWPWTKKGAGIESVTRSEAWTMGSDTPVVMVEGHSGGIWLEHVEVIT